MFILSTLLLFSFINVFVLWPMVMLFTGFIGSWVMIAVQMIVFTLIAKVSYDS